MCIRDRVNRRQAKADVMTGTTNGGLVIPNFYNFSNSRELPTVSEASSYKRVNSVYESASFGFNDTFFVDVTNRTDWSSALPDKPYNLSLIHI